VTVLARSSSGISSSRAIRAAIERLGSRWSCSRYERYAWATWARAARSACVSPRASRAARIVWPKVVPPLGGGLGSSFLHFRPHKEDSVIRWVTMRKRIREWDGKFWERRSSHQGRRATLEWKRHDGPSIYQPYDTQHVTQFVERVGALIEKPSLSPGVDEG
jgi:hypothetical protein